MSVRIVLLSAISIAFVHICPGQNAVANVDLIQNWPAPLYWKPASGHSEVNHGRVREQVSGTSSLGVPALFVAMSPCRVIETRNPNGPFGGPAFAPGETRTYAIPSGPCTGIPSNDVAYSVNITVVPLTTQMKWLTAWDTGSTQPKAATLTDYTGQVISNAAVVPAGTGGEINIFVTDPTDVVVDINGYYAMPSDLLSNTAFGTGALQYNTTGSGNTASGYTALSSNTTGEYNTASGVFALATNTTGSDNTASGVYALQFNTIGNNNTASGFNALSNNTTGSANTASGADALQNNTTGYSNTASGTEALQANTTGFGNTASGSNALQYNNRWRQHGQWRQRAAI
jgi:hypothetical protein